MLDNLLEWQRGALRASFNAFATTLNYQAQALKAAHCVDLANFFTASAEVSSRFGKDNPKPSFNLPVTIIGNQSVAVKEEILVDKPFGALLHFKRDTTRNDPKILIVAPMSGHYATLMRKTIETMLPHHDIYITDWKNPRHIPLSQGDFNLENYIDYVQEFIKVLGPDIHIGSHSQSTVPTLAVVSLLAAQNSAVQPLSMALAGGPIDTRIHPTAIDQYARDHSLQWFRDHVISRVPNIFAGYGRKVYSGDLQFALMTSMNPGLHMQAYKDLFNHVRHGRTIEADKIRKFRDEYESVSDLPASYYLDTIEQVFQKFTLPRGEMTWKGQPVDPSKIRHTALLTLEGGKDPICSPGQTSAAHLLCKNIGRDMHFSNIEKQAGHYDLLDGGRWAGFIRTAAAQKGITYDPVPANAAITLPVHVHPEQVKQYLYNVPASANDDSPLRPKLRQA